MDDSITPPASHRPGSPAVVMANWFRFRSGQTVRHARVDSVCLIWSVRGNGSIRSHGMLHRLGPGDLLRLPWGHDVEYAADLRSPFHLGTIHLIPWHDDHAPVELDVAHQRNDPLFGSPDRADVDARHPVPLLIRASALTRDFIALGSYCVERYMSRNVDAASARAFGRLVDFEDSRLTRPPEQAGWPPTLHSMVEYVSLHLGEVASVAEVARYAGCSESTAQRLFTTHTGHSVAGWIRAQRMRTAARLLETSGMRVNEVARTVGFTDALYFSRVFRETYSVSPSRYAAGRLRP
jgi:AraC-like DNA-binding protein